MTDQCRKFLVFSLNRLRYAVDLSQVAEVGDPPQIWPIPLAPPYYSGAFNFHGDIVAVINLPLFLGIAGCGQPGKIIVLHHETVSLAFHVDAIVRIVSEDEISVCKPCDASFAGATLALPDGEATQLDLETLIRAVETGSRETQYRP